SKLKSWIIKYGRRDSVELLLDGYVEMEKNITGFYQALEKASRITGSRDSEGPGDFKHKCQELVTYTHSCKKCLAVIERSHQSIQKNLDASKTLQHMQTTLLQKRVSDLQSSSQDFFRNLSHWIQQHMDMNDAGNFLIETCDETVSRDLKQQLLLLNGRWRELFVKVKHYARADEVDKLKTDYQEGINTLKLFLDATNEKMSAPVQVSFLNVRTFVQDLLAKDSPEDEVSQMLALMASVKEQLAKHMRRNSTAQAIVKGQHRKERVN
ncbi:hypothetical protein CRUP_038029, partial [Coryphaenoides rupestris]